MSAVKLSDRYTLIYDDWGKLSEVVSEGNQTIARWNFDGVIANEYDPESNPEAAEYFAYVESLSPSQQPAFYRADMNNNPPPPPSWGSFRMAMLQDADYRSLTQMADVLKVQRLENAISMSADEIFLPAVVQLWNEMVTGLLLPDGAIEQWQSIANAAFVPLKWRDDGTLEPTL